jgi:hypothetical protein
VIISAEVVSNKMYTKNIASMMDEHSTHKNPAQSTQGQNVTKVNLYKSKDLKCSITVLKK